MIDFRVDEARCVKCGACVDDCPARVIFSDDGGVPFIPPEKEGGCYRCQHCLAVCPTAAVSVVGVNPDRTLPIRGAIPSPEGMEALIRGRRSVRRYRQENLPRELFDRLLTVAWQAPTGVNARDVLFTVVDDRERLALLRDEVMGKIRDAFDQGRVPDSFSFFSSFVRLWYEKGVDIIFRDAPHLVIASAPRAAASPEPDCLIALSYFELYAASCGVGTVWNGLAKWGMFELADGMRERLNIPEDHLIGYVMSFGYPAVVYHRGVDHGAPTLNRVV